MNVSLVTSSKLNRKKKCGEGYRMSTPLEEMCEERFCATQFSAASDRAVMMMMLMGGRIGRHDQGIWLTES